MNTTIREEDGKVVIAFEGRLDTAASAQVSKDVEAVYERVSRDVVVDCTKLTYISSSGLRILLGIRKHVSGVGGSVGIIGANADIREVLYTTGFNNLFYIR